MAVLLLAEHDNGTLKDATAKALTAAQGSSAATSTSSSPARAAARSPSAAKLDGVAKVLLAEAPRLGTAWPSRWRR
jgi:electron transfer flavoprotein alpha subunit